MTISSTWVRPAFSRDKVRAPAMDGIRGFFIIIVLLYHFGVTGLVGGWIAINHFFVFSGFLLTRILLSTRAKSGRVQMLRYYLGRARRVLPAMLVLVVAVVVHTAVFGPAQLRREFFGDAAATVGFVLNWRLIARDDAYFGSIGPASPLRHAWTLSVEEQFYVILPILIIATCFVTGRRAARVGLMLAAAAISSLWGRHLIESGASASHLYYGTDVRAPAFFVGMALAFMLGRDDDGRAPRPAPRLLVDGLGFVGLVICISSLFLLDQNSRWLYTDGGVLLFALAAAVTCWATTDPRRLWVNRPFELAPLVFLGRITYGLYLFHWPIGLWLPLTSWPLPVSILLKSALTLACAVLSFRFIEEPVLRGGLAALFRRRVPRGLGPCCVAGVAALAIGLWASAPTSAVGPVSRLVPGQRSYAAPSPPRSIVAIGDSVPYELVRDFDAAQFPGTTVTSSAALGCDLLSEPGYLGANNLNPQSPQCRQVRDGLPGQIARAHADTAVIFGSMLLAEPHLAPSGKPVGLGDAAYEQLVFSALNHLVQQARDAGAHTIALVNVPCRDLDGGVAQDYAALVSANPQVKAQMERPLAINALLAAWVRTQPEVRTINLYQALCSAGFKPQVDGLPLYADGVHFSAQAAPSVWGWLLPQLVDQPTSTKP